MRILFHIINDSSKGLLERAIMSHKGRLSVYYGHNIKKHREELYIYCTELFNPYKIGIRFKYVKCTWYRITLDGKAQDVWSEREDDTKYRNYTLYRMGDLGDEVDLTNYL